MSFKKAFDSIDLRDKENYYNVSNFKKRIKYLKDLLKATQSSSKFKTYNNDSYNFIFDDYKNLRNVSSQDINDLFASTTMLNQFFMDENAEETRNKLSGQGKSSKSRKTNNNDYFVIKL
jgi:Zn-dependent M32 family carboxypeptidase